MARKIEFRMDRAAEQRLDAYLAMIGEVLNNKKRRESFAAYALGLLGDGDRKSCEPIAARACGDPATADAAHQRLLHFVGVSDWDDQAVRLAAARHALRGMVTREAVNAWIIDDTGFLKQGKHSVGVQRQYSGSAGKITNCQLGVSLSIATKSLHVPIDFELYLPQSWTDDPQRRAEAHIPAEVPFATKADLALGMVRRAVEEGVAEGVVLADSAYGDDPTFRAGVTALGLKYAVGVHRDHRVWWLDSSVGDRRKALAVHELATQLSPQCYRTVTWREGTRRKLRSRFAILRVVPAHRDREDPPAERDEVWLVIDWPRGEAAPTHYYFATVDPDVSFRSLVGMIQERYRTEQVYRELKSELGLDHFEGRSFRGWHHHVSVALACYAYIVAERARAFPPSGDQTWSHSPNSVAA